MFLKGPHTKQTEVFELSIPATGRLLWHNAYVVAFRNPLAHSDEKDGATIWFDTYDDGLPLPSRHQRLKDYVRDVVTFDDEAEALEYLKGDDGGPFEDCLIHFTLLGMEVPDGRFGLLMEEPLAFKLDEELLLEGEKEGPTDVLIWYPSREVCTKVINEKRLMPTALDFEQFDNFEAAYSCLLNTAKRQDCDLAYMLQLADSTQNNIETASRDPIDQS